MVPESDMKLEHARWLLDRSDHLRSSYANRAALVLGIDTGILGALFAVLGLVKPNFTGLARALTPLALMLTSISVVYAFLASSSLRSKRRTVDKEDSGKRLFLSPKNTFGEEAPEFTVFQSRFAASCQDAFIGHVVSELFVALSLQDRRYLCLKRSIYALFGAMGVIVALFLILLLR
jgi:hypothetical protein